ncbi:NAD(P)H-quinone oxidoreductase [Methylovirgula sp. 4M-Z18]|uniref:NAD(P)H-quinone oxidoreductase n=1 Tax=Methylovirgula sp. 4M-Z18 TaxID=2293567 RepID=UPI000E2E5F8A|nr:NAD(P)H-quinone oxidoreductase [Methylovirgula sp. 4M-Z18]RFB81359.1 NAD(P)H-quinone oxidoreductase [Methylovirgula sp. 4M-Z18]
MTLPPTMTAIAISQPGAPDVLKPETRPVPAPGPGEILVKVAYAGVNRPDVLQRLGVYAPPPGASDLPGLEISGTVAALGEGVTRWSVGDTVCALVAGGGYAEYCLVHESHALPVPAGLDLEQAGATPETFFTVWVNVFMRAGLRPGESFLVHGGTSGIGVTAIQLAKAFGARVFATAGTDEKCAACRRFGADVALNYREDWVAAVKAEAPLGINVILDMVGGDYVAKNYTIAAELGRIAQIAHLNGHKVTIDLRPMMQKRLTHTGSTLRPRTIAEKAEIASQLQAHVWPLLATGRCRPPIDSTFPLHEAAKAHERMESGAHIGKIVLKV